MYVGKIRLSTPLTILREGPLARVALTQRVGLTAAAISNITRELIENGLLWEVGTVRGGSVGAHAILLSAATIMSVVSLVVLIIAGVPISVEVVTTDADEMVGQGLDIGGFLIKLCLFCTLHAATACFFIRQHP